MLILTSYSRQNHRQQLAKRIPAVLACLSLFFMLMGCQSEPFPKLTTGKKEIQTVSHPTSEAPTKSAQIQQQPQLEIKKMSQIETFDQLSESYDSRLTDIMRQSIPGDVIVSFYYISISKDYSPNYRWELHQDGRLFLVHHSGKNISFDITFDHPLPLKPTKILTKSQIQALNSQFEQAKFFEQPKFQKRLNVEGGSCVIVRVRHGDKSHEVVYENVESSLIEYLYSIAY
jgi:hypothetical protein